MEELCLSGDEEGKIVVGDEALKDQEGGLEFCVVGKFLTN